MVNGPFLDGFGSTPGGFGVHCEVLHSEYAELAKNLIASGYQQLVPAILVEYKSSLPSASALKSIAFIYPDVGYSSRMRWFHSLHTLEAEHG